MKPLARRLLVPTLLLFAILAAGAVAVGAFTQEQVVPVPAQIGIDGGFMSDAASDAGIDTPEMEDAPIDAPMDAPLMPDDGPISLLP